MRHWWNLFLFLFTYSQLFSSSVKPGLDVFFEEGYDKTLQGKKAGLILNHTSLDLKLRSSIERFQNASNGVVLKALFSPEHGLHGKAYAEEKLTHTKHSSGIPIYSLYGKTKRPTDEMLKDIDVLIYDIQDLGSRTYTYVNTLFLVMEQAAKNKIPVYVLDRPNPINGLMVDGPMLEEKWRSFIGYIDVPYCHGMTVGELAKYFNEEYKIHCDLHVVKMRGWKRFMRYKQTGLTWIPPSPHIPEADTAYFYPATGILGELKIVNIGVGYTLPFKVVGAPWIDATQLADKLNAQNLPGVHFVAFHFKPFYGLYKEQDCHGVMIRILDFEKFKPLSVQYLLLGMLKSMYPKEFLKRLEASAVAKKMFCLANGSDKIYNLLKEEKYPAWKLIEISSKPTSNFLEKRKKYLLYD